MGNGYDIAILGGGLAGLSLSIQLKKHLPDARILVAERTRHPVPEAAFKVGESTAEVGARYFSEIIGMKQHLETRHLRKMGPRYFFTHEDNRDITRRVEVGPASQPRIPAYQIDRGRFENALAEVSQELGVDVLAGCSVREVELDPKAHRIWIQNGKLDRTVRARWVVDATGRAGVLKRQLELARPNRHNVNAVWFRIAESICLDDWSDAPDWQGRVPSRSRVLSTNHLMGDGYWVWLIPLGSGSISVGIVADPARQPWEEWNTFDRALRWLWRHEPQCAAEVARRRELRQDFRTMVHFSHDCHRVFSPQRWCLTGEAGVFLDPFYSPGSDFISVGNGYIDDLICRDLAGEDINARAEFFNQQMLTLFRESLPFYEGQYPIMGNAQVMTAKVVWDTAAYWSLLALLFFHGKLCDVDFSRAVQPLFLQFITLNTRMQTFFREWSASPCASPEGVFVNLQAAGFLFDDIYGGLTACLDDAGVEERLRHNLEVLREFADDIGRAAGIRVGRAAVYGGQEAWFKSFLRLGTLNSMNLLASLYHDQGRDAEAEPLHLKALAGRRRELGEENFSTLISMNNLAVVYLAQGRYGEAEALLTKAVAVGRRVRDPRHPVVRRFVTSLARLRLAQHKYAEAEALLRDALDQESEQSGPEQFEREGLLGLSLSEQAKFAEAEPLLISSCRALLHLKGTIPNTTISRAGQRALQLYADWGKPEGVAELLAELQAAGVDVR